MDQPIPSDYAELLRAVKERVRSAQHSALRAINTQLISLYWDIGRMICERQGGSIRGRAVVARLAEDLHVEMPGVRGFSVSNLWRMRDLYLTDSSVPKPAQVVRETGWGHHIVILQRCKDPLEREFYLRMSRRTGWSRSTLQSQLERQAYERAMLSQSNFAATLPEPVEVQARLALKDEYTFDFLDLADEHSERELETAILARVGPFLREMGGQFAFVGSRFKLEVADEEFFVDRLLYHRGLKCLVALELKTGRFQPEHVGKMQLYLAVLDSKVRLRGEEPSIGIILCRSRDKAIVEYALRESAKPIGVAAYRMVRALPAELKGLLPEPEQVLRLLDGV